MSEEKCTFVQNLSSDIFTSILVTFKKLYNVICRQNQTVTRGKWTTSTQGSAALDIDAGLYSKIERGERPAKREQVINLANILHTDEKELLTLWLADQIKEITDMNKDVAEEAMEMVKMK